MGTAIAAVLGGAVFLGREAVVALYARDAAVVAAALPLLACVALFHVADAAQTIAAFVLRAWRIATIPLLVNATALWGVGLGGGFVLAFGGHAWVPLAWRGAAGFWTAATAGLVLTALALTGLLAHVMRRQRAA